jgi:hypothetical protein
MGMKWAEHIACVGEKRNAYRILMDRDKQKELEVDGEIIIK